MRTRFNRIKAALALSFITGTLLPAQVNILDAFENTECWSAIKSDDVNLTLSAEKGLSGNAIRIDYDFTEGSGFGGVQKLFPIILPDNYEFTFYLKADLQANNF